MRNILFFFHAVGDGLSSEPLLANPPMRTKRTTVVYQRKSIMKRSNCMNGVTLQYNSQMAPPWNSYSSYLWRAFAVHDPIHRRVAVSVGGGHRGSALWQQRARVRDGQVIPRVSANLPCQTRIKFHRSTFLFSVLTSLVETVLAECEPLNIPEDRLCEDQSAVSIRLLQRSSEN